MANSDNFPVADFDHVTSHSSLLEAFTRVAKAGGGAGGDGMSLARFATDTRRELKTLAGELKSGRYRPRPLLRHSIKKQGGGKRQLAIPAIRDRIVQKSLATALDQTLDSQMSGASFAYRKGRSIEHAAALVMFWRLRGFDWAVDGDIEKFFDNVPHTGIDRSLSGFKVCKRTIQLVLLWLNHFSRNGRGLAQGSPLSPVLANLYLAPFDRAMQTKRIKLVRYADDFLLLTRTRQEALDARNRAEKELARLGLRLNMQKSGIVKLEDGLDFLGFRVSGNGIRRG